MIFGRDKIAKAITYIIYSICFLILAFMAYSTIYCLCCDTSLRFANKMMCFLLAAGLIIFSSYIAIKINRKNEWLFLALLIFCSGASCLAWNIFAKTQPVSDYKVLLEGALKIANGTFSEGYDKTSYFYFYNYQIGYISYLSILIKLFGYSLNVIKLFDSINIVLSAVLIYMIVRRLSNKAAGAVSSLLFAEFVFIITGSSVINNQHLSSLLMLFGIYLIILDRIWSIGLSGLAFAAMNVIRPEGIILLIAFCIFFICKMLRSGNWREWIIKIALLVFSFCIIVWTFNMAFMGLKLTPGPISKSNIPYFKMVIGLGAENGSMNGHRSESARKTNVYFDLKDSDFDYDAYNREARKFVFQRIFNVRTYGYLFEKMRLFTGGRDNQYTFALTDKSKVNGLMITGHFQYLALIIFSLISILLRLRKEKVQLNQFAIIFIGFICVHILVEAQTRYRYEAYICLIVTASEAISYFIADFHSRFTFSKNAKNFLKKPIDWS